MKKNNSLDENYLNLVKLVKETGTIKKDRTGTGTISIFGTSIEHDMKNGFPLLTSKQMSIKSIAAELRWFLSGSTDIRDLWDAKCYIWDGDWYKKYSSKSGNVLPLEEIKKIARTSEPDYLFDLGPIYGKQWRNFNGIDQIKNLIEDIKNNPDSRRLMVSAWNPSDLTKMTLPPCHYGFQCYTRELTQDERLKIWDELYLPSVKPEDSLDPIDLDGDGIPKRELSLIWNQRSVDTLLGLPYNIASYALLLLLLCRETNCVPGKIRGNLGDTHIYLDQLPLIEKQLNNDTYPLPVVLINNYNSFESFKTEDLILINYQHAGKVSYPLSN